RAMNKSCNIMIVGVGRQGSLLASKILGKLLAEEAPDTLSASESAGSSKAVNLVLMGRLSKYFSIAEEKWLKIIEDIVPPKFAELNKKAFLLGRQKQETALNV
ncbi:MAG: hypothetical protein K2K44_05855, partial [Oscillospiraceae bacterium]|nr:hypothetical protein [Oscillospiraceae bacterium]